MAHRIASGFALLVAASALAAPVPKGAGKNTTYFPTVVGAQWVYEHENGGEEAAEVADVEKDGDALIVSRKGVGENNSRYTKMVVSADGLRQDREDDDGNTATVWVLKTTLKPGESWKVADGGKRTVYGPEEVSVAAGKFQALRVVWEYDGRLQTSWYAPGIGEVKRTVKRGDEKEVVTRTLKSFREGKK